MDPGLSKEGSEGTSGMVIRAGWDFTEEVLGVCGSACQYFAPGLGLALGSPAFVVVNGNLFTVDKARVFFSQESPSNPSPLLFLISGMLGTGKYRREDDFLGVTLNQEAIAMKTVYGFLMEKENASNSLDNLEKVDAFLKKCHLKKLKQKSITDFFKL
ncbi:hypothetical protein AVEN_213517-1 [Araneus ventricosus]|uniref:Uncharacterized protein n=1 Tax=Araneus ventricosus TaxID=182803 RepID=A0A4Y2SNI8_ARAVE|nr:hypothetical protein AVEN_213517-1 [Araneus ventricosus]